MLFRGVPNALANDTALTSMLAYINAVFDTVDVTHGETVVANLARLRNEGVLSDEEAAGFACQLFMAGHETTTLLTGNCLDFLSVNPDIFATLGAVETIPKFLDEMVRYRPPVHRLTRYAARDVEIAGCRIPAGASVRLLIASANRDLAKFEDPDRFDPLRKNAAHAGFGYGIHMCIGSWLAKLEVRLMLETLVATTARLEPDTRWPRQPLAGGAFATVGLHSLGLKVTPL
jgi:cytochrome P450